MQRGSGPARTQTHDLLLPNHCTTTFLGYCTHKILRDP
uniref:Uncharacterized protein n=1 Tax=Anguilla anguilla TaxID=7936 RepID=A0A0E9TJE6_ANGAN